jgi:hypothetical protein
LNNQVVNTKGQKFTIVEEKEDERMKGTYISLKITHTKRAGGKGFK